MLRSDIATALLGTEPPRLWVPLLTRYAGDEAAVDQPAMAAHAAALARNVGGMMIAGTTGDGWDLADAQWLALLDLAAGDALRGLDVRILLAVLRPTTDEVLALVARIHAATGTRGDAPLAANVARLRELGWAGICVCPPCGADVGQEAIRAHYAAIAAAARLPLAVYQLPQVTGCEIAPATMARLVADHEEIILFKDSSGADRVARQSRLPADAPLLVRGAESDYASVLEPLGGPYGGLLLATANVFGERLGRIVRDAFAGRPESASREGADQSALVARLFAAGAEAPRGNAFSCVARAALHVRDHGARWRAAPAPRLFDGSRLPEAYVARIAEAMAG